MLITPFSPPLTPAAVAPGGVSGDGAAFEKLMTTFRPAGREDAASGQSNGSGMDRGEKEPVDTVLAVADPATTSPEPDAAGEGLQDTLAISVQTAPVAWQSATAPPVAAPASGDAPLTQPTMLGAAIVAASPAVAIGAGQMIVGAMDAAWDQTKAAAQQAEGATTTGSAAPRFAAVAEVQTAPVRPPVADAPDTAVPAPLLSGSQAAGLAMQPGAGGAIQAAPAGPSGGGADLPLTAAAAPPVSEKTSRKPGSAAAQGTGAAVAANAAAEAGKRVEATASAYDASRAPPDARHAKPTDASTPAPSLSNPVPMVTEFWPDLAAASGIGRDGVAGAGPATGGGGAASPATPPPASQLSQTIVQIIQRGADTPVEVTLRPEELGKVRFDMLTTGDRLHITLFIERPEAMDLIRRHGEQLLNDLRQSGFSNPSLSFGDWSQRDTRPAKPATPPKPAEGGTAAYDITAGAPARTIAAGRLDLRL
ncbi:MAG: flagellar hook-length control protein FliK [Pseudotabrizicola sp.]|uniref:flagellar hook-length control protein FliK n=1 Tax=Pseudotabrizicola sp. TaxID=2939647 RepID=UPI0027288DC5|nr:flagellar hook-length control protein FliK [Pseudotabrizicola sp.]MDO9639085.1 flagellar hook-length control protein FliK [Pseudotabrizicola sp.]